MRTETLSDEQAVRGAHPNLFMTQRNAAIWQSKESRDRWLFGGSCQSIHAEGYLGCNWHYARQHPTVVAWEAKQGQSAKVERPSAKGMIDRVHFPPIHYIRRIAELEAERDQLLAENARLREAKP